MTRKLSSLCGTALAVLTVGIAPVSVAGNATRELLPVVTKQTGSAYSLCQAELRRRMGGTRSIVSIVSFETIPSATTMRLAGRGTYDRGDGSRLQSFNFSCIVNLPQSRVSSLSYTFTSD